MNRKTFSIALALMVMPVMLFAQSTVSEDKNTITITEETETAEGKIVTTTVLEKNKVFTSGMWQNWEVIVGGGAHLYYGDNDWKVGSKLEMITAPVFDLYLTKWISPSFGIGLSASSGRFKGLYQSRETGEMGANFRTDIPYTGADPKYDYMRLARQRSWVTDIYADFHVDFGNLLFGYNPERFFTVDGYLGGGLMMGWDEKGFIPGATANLGLINKFRLTRNLMLAVDLRGALVSDDFDGESFNQEPDLAHWKANHKMDGNAGVTVGLAINLGKDRNKWRPASRVSTVIKNNDRAIATDVAPQVVKVVDTVMVSNVPKVWFHINFVIDRWDLLSREMVNLNAVADLIKSTPDVRYLICGYADKQTATPEHNKMLSENRSKAVYDALVNDFGVNPGQLVRDYKGGVDYMFYDEKELSRCVMITAIQE
ncbi:MAG: OmpA family protein [Bacteroidales bacterium]|nr:OmpA family protein [Bacteroidales bacterium]